MLYIVTVKEWAPHPSGFAFAPRQLVKETVKRFRSNERAETYMQRMVDKNLDVSVDVL